MRSFAHMRRNAKIKETKDNVTNHWLLSYLLLFVCYLSVCYLTLGSDFQNRIDFLWRKSAKKLKGWSPKGKKTHTTISLGIEWHCKMKKFKTQNQKHKYVFLISFSFYLISYFFSRNQTTKLITITRVEREPCNYWYSYYTRPKKEPIKRPKTHIQKQTRVKKNNNNNIYRSLLLLLLCSGQQIQKPNNNFLKLFQKQRQ